MTPRRSLMTSAAGLAAMALLAACTSSSGSSTSPASGATTSTAVTTTTAVTTATTTATTTAAVTSPAGGSPTISSPAISSPTISTSTAAGKQADPAVIADLEKLVLRRADFPAGWAAKANVNSTTISSSGGQSALVKCAGGTDTATHLRGQYNSDVFSTAKVSVSSSATRYASAADLLLDAALLRRPKVAACEREFLRQSFAASLPSGGVLKSVSLAVHPGAGGGPADVVGTAVGGVVITAGAEVVRLSLTKVFINGARTEAEVDVEGVNESIPPAALAALVRTEAARVAGR